MEDVKWTQVSDHPNLPVSITSTCGMPSGRERGTRIDLLMHMPDGEDFGPPDVVELR